jgi:integrase
MHTHQFRHLAGCLILKKRRHLLTTVSDLLGRRSIETTRACYSRMDQVAASERFHEILAEYLEEDGRDAVD